MTMGVDIAVGIGSNIDPSRYIPAALEALRARFGTLEVSTLYRCPAVGFDGADFINLVVMFSTGAPIEQVQTALRDIETENGRAQRARDGSRTLDLDLLLYGATIHDDGTIRVPRADIIDYAFVLAPLAELRPQGVHPSLGRTYAALWADENAPRQPLIAIDWAELTGAD
ncbi:MAG: 2-amino-4-hydroxy-6-hydroxymethyldihydropteridine diphosphokinase [Xanthomonadales bacterium]|nr:2-amino-4-hydroxy-6-hydroxymethyldihydropteridine diphosphokinase [Xanthomonadales bacterium]